MSRDNSKAKEVIGKPEGLVLLMAGILILNHNTVKEVTGAQRIEDMFLEISNLVRNPHKGLSKDADKLVALAQAWLDTLEKCHLAYLAAEEDPDDGEGEGVTLKTLEHDSWLLARKDRVTSLLAAFNKEKVR
jgi:hypothetical protein